MEISRLLRLDRPDKLGRVPIHLRICWRSNKVRLSSGEKVMPSDWDDKKGGHVRGKADFASAINNRLDLYEFAITTFIYAQEGAGIVVTEDMVRQEIERIRTKELGRLKPVATPTLPEVISSPALPSIIDFNQRYRDEQGSGRSTSWHRSMRVVGDHLLAYRPDLDWSGLKLSTLNLFKVYLQQEEDVSDATLAAYVGLLRGMLKYAGRSEMPVPADWSYLEVKRPGDAIQPELEPNEIPKLLNAKLYKPERKLPNYGKFDADDMEMTRWYFSIACHTGIRHSDLWQLQTPKITSIENIPCLDIVQRKTQKRVSIPLIDDAYHLVRNPPRKEPPRSRDQYNFMLKEVGQQANLDREVMTGSYYKGKLLSELHTLYDTMNSHMARRTFATLMSSGGMPTKTLQELMGHASIASTAKYSRVPNNIIVQQAINAWKSIIK